ncbi:MAG: hypothetical protein ABIM30_00005 [candidate division WOR-3 bacterium]
MSKIKNFVKNFDSVIIVTHPGVGHIDEFLATGLVANICEEAGIKFGVIKTKEIPTPAPGEGVIILDQMGGQEFGPHVLVVDHHGGDKTNACTFMQVLEDVGIKIPSKGMLGKILAAVNANDTGINFGGYQYGLLDLILVKQLWTAAQGEVSDGIVEMAKSIAGGLLKIIEKEAAKMASIKKVGDGVYLGGKEVSPPDVLEIDSGAEILIQPNSQQAGCTSIVAITKNGISGDTTKFLPKLEQSGAKIEFVHPKKFVVVVKGDPESVAEAIMA